MELKEIAKELRKELVQKHHDSGYSHLGSDLSCLDILIELYFNIMKPEDRFILSKGHAAVAFYAILHKKGIISDNEYKTLGKDSTKLSEHPLNEIKEVEFATGSLGHGLSLACGLALANRNSTGRIYVLLSDGELSEGSTMEAAMFAGRMKLNNLTAIIDYNNFQAYDRTMTSKAQAIAMFSLANWITKPIPNRHESLEDAFSSHSFSGNQPMLILVETKLGEGIPSIEDNLAWHYKVPNEEQTKEFIKEI